MTTAFYRTGTVAVTQNSKVVTGTGTNWTTGPTKPLAGDVFIFNNKMYEIDSVVSDTEIRLYRNLEDSTASSKSYAIMRNASLNISARIAAQVAQVVNQKQIMIDEFHDFLTNNTDSTVPLTDTLGNTIDVTPIPMLDKDYVEKIGGIDSAVNQAIQDINDKFDSYEYILMREAEARGIQWQNENVNFDASGFVHNGKGTTSVVYKEVNQGLMVRSDIPDFSDSIVLGRVGASQSGGSKTPFPVIHIAGAVANALHIGDRPEFFGVSYELPPAPDGTQISEATGNARGSGQAYLDLKVDIDPKYGDIPTGTGLQILREALERAFEGWVGNSNFRLPLSNGGIGNWNGLANPNISINNGELHLNSGSQGSNVSAVQKLAVSVVKGAKYKVCITKVSGANTATANLSTTGGFDPNLQIVRGSDPAGVYEYEYTPEDSGDVYVQLYGINNNIGKFSSVTFHPTTEKVVTHPVDLVCLEYYEEELTGRKEVFECIQSTSTTFGTTSVPTVLSTRKLSYFQQYDGQFPEVAADPNYINDRYRCVVWDDLTELQKREVAADMGEKLFKGVNGNIVNGRLRARTIRGAGNGDWDLIKVVGTYGGVTESNKVMTFKGNSRVQPQGVFNTPNGGSSVNSDLSRWYGGAHHTNPTMPDFTSKGVWGAGGGGVGYQNRCFLYVVATVPRANKGAYVEGLNEYGCARLLGNNGSWRQMWHSDILLNTPKTTKDCFKFTDAPTANWTSDDFVYHVSGTIDDGFSGNPDGIFCDGIETGGLNGVIDWRLPAVANESPEEAAKVEVKVENGTYRGLEKLVKTRVKAITPANAQNGNLLWTGSDNTPNSNNNGWIALGEAKANLNLVAGLRIFAYDGDLDKVYSATVVAWEIASGSQVFARCIFDDWVPNVTVPASSNTYSIIEEEINLSVSGEFLVRDVYAAPSNLLQIDSLENGWLGCWVGMPDGSTSRIKMSRKVRSASPAPRQFSQDYGVSWVIVSASPDFTLNTMYASPEVNGVQIYSYKAFAKQTKKSKSKPIYNGKSGLMDVFYTMRDLVGFGNSIAESLIGKVLVSNYVSNHKGSLNVTRVNYNPVNGTISDGVNHSPLVLDAPNNNSQGIKVLPYQISNNGQGSIGYQANELTWDESSGDWGDDSKIKVTEAGLDIFADLNGKTNISVVHELAIPFTWTSNHSRTGKQIEGVDL